MKTKEELAKECALKEGINPDFDWRDLGDCWCPHGAPYTFKTIFLAGYKAAQRWIPVEERLPNAYTPVLVYSEGRVMGRPFIVQAELHEGSTQGGETVLGWVWMCDPDYEYRSFYPGGDPTHWMPLPEAPK